MIHADWQVGTRPHAIEAKRSKPVEFWSGTPEIVLTILERSLLYQTPPQTSRFISKSADYSKIAPCRGIDICLLFMLRNWSLEPVANSQLGLVGQDLSFLQRFQAMRHVAHKDAMQQLSSFKILCNATLKLW